MLKRLKAHRPPGGRWIKRSDRIFLSFFLFLLLASFVVSHLPQSSQSSSSQALIPSSSSLPSASSSVSPSSASQGGYGGLQASQNTNSNSATGLTPTPTRTLPPEQKDPKAGPETSAGGIKPSPGDIGDNWLLDGGVGLLAWTDPNLTIGSNTQIQTAWGGVLAMADLFLVLFIMINGIRVMMGGVGFRYADAIEALPRIILAFAAANLSQLFIENLISINNGMCQIIWLFAQANGLEYMGGVTVGDLLRLGITILISAVATILAGTVGDFLPIAGSILQGAAFGGFITSCITFLVDLTLLTLYLFLAIQLIIRLALINLLSILAPLGFASWALPQGAGQQIMRIWLNATFASILVQFLQLTCYVFGLILFLPIAGLTGKDIPLVSFFSNVGFNAGDFFKIAVVWLTLRVPGLVQNVTTQTMGEGSRNMASMISQTLGTATSAISTAAIALR